jgi:hypothetical protein
MTQTDGVLQVQVAADEADLAHLDALTRQLRIELLEREVGRVEPAPGGPAPPGTRSGELAAVGALLVSVAGKAGLLPAVIDTIKGWLTRVRQPVVVKVELNGDVLEISGASATEREQVIDAWLARHAAPPGGPAPADGAAGG